MNKRTRVALEAMCEEVSAALGLHVTGIAFKDADHQTVWTLSVSDDLNVLYGPERSAQITAPVVKFELSPKPSPALLLRGSTDVPEWWVKYLAIYGPQMGEHYFYARIGVDVRRGNYIEIVIEHPPVWVTVTPGPMPLPERVSDYTLRLLRDLADGNHLFARHKHHVVSMYMSRVGMWHEGTPVNVDIFLKDLSREVDAGYMVDGHYVPVADSIKQFAYIKSQLVYSGEDCIIYEVVLTDDGRAFLERMKG